MEDQDNQEIIPKDEGDIPAVPEEEVAKAQEEVEPVIEDEKQQIIQINTVIDNAVPEIHIAPP